MYQNVDDDATRNFFQNQEYMPNPPTDTRDILAFRRWNASSWVRPMYFLSLLTMFFILVTQFVSFVDNGGSAGIVFFGVVLILVCCGACVIFHRILYELIMAFLQLPKLIAAMERLSNTVDQTNKSANGPQQPVMTTGYQQ